MPKDVLHRPALAALLTVATSPRRWTTQSEIASDMGVTHSTLSNALSGRRGLSDESLARLGETLGVDARSALVLPWVARPGDVRTKEVERRLHAVQDELTSLYRVIRQGQLKGD